MITHNDPPNPCIPYSKPKPMTTNRSPISSSTHIRLSNMIPLQLHNSPIIRPPDKHPNYISMMTRYHPWRNVPRPPHPYCTKRPPIRNNPVYCLRSILLCRIFLSILSFQPSSYPRPRRLLTPNRNYPFKSPRSTPSKYISPPSIRSLNYMSPSQPNRRQPKPYKPSPTNHHSLRIIFHYPTSLRVFRNIIFYLRRNLRLNILHSNGISWPPRNYWLNFPNCLSTTTTKIPLHIKTSFRIWSRSMILTLRRCSLTIPIRFYLLMRILLP